MSGWVRELGETVPLKIHSHAMSKARVRGGDGKEQGREGGRDVFGDELGGFSHAS